MYYKPADMFPFLIGKVLTKARGIRPLYSLFPFLIGKVLTFLATYFAVVNAFSFPFLIGKVLTGLKHL